LRKRNRITAYLLLTLSLLLPGETGAAEANGQSAGERCISAGIPGDSGLNWSDRIKTDETEGAYLTRLLGMDQVTRQSVIRTIEENWTEGLNYNNSAYAVNHEDAAMCTNYSGRQMSGREKKDYGYNCTGFVASVLYYANGGTTENALENMNELYRSLKQGRSFTDGTAWYYFFDREIQTEEGKTAKTNIYAMGEVTDANSLQTLLKWADMEGKLKEGYLLYFWPSSGWDCHLGVYAGKSEDGLYMMYHAAGKGEHFGVELEKSITMSQATCEGPSYVYIVPLPDEELVGWQEIRGRRYHYFEQEKKTLRWYKEDEDWYYFDPDSGEMCTGWQEIDGYRYYFTDEGQMLSVAMVGPYCIDRFGVCMNYR